MGVGKSCCLSSPYTAQNKSARKHDTDISREHVRTNNQWDEKSCKHRANKSPKVTSVDDSARSARETNHSKHSGKSMFSSTNEVKSSQPTTSNKWFKDPYQMFTSESSGSVTRTNGQDVKQPHQKGKNKVSATFDEKENSPMLTNAINNDLEKASRNQAKSSSPRNITSNFLTECPRYNDESRANAFKTEAQRKSHSGSETRANDESRANAFKTEAQRKDHSGSETRANDESRANAFKTEAREKDHSGSETRSNDESRANALKKCTVTPEAWTKGHTESETKQNIDETNGDQHKQTKKKKEKKRHHPVAREADDIKRTTGDENHAVNPSNDTNKTSEYESNIKKLEARVRQLTYEKDGLLNRLSEIQAINLTENNPNITDLSDAFRPQKIEEQFSELYDNEWTDAYEYLTKVRKEDNDLSVKQLLQILQEVFALCMSSTHEKKIALQQAVANYVGLTNDDQEEFDFKDIKKRIREYRTKKFDMNIRNFEKEVEDKLKSSFTTDTFKELSTYTGRCVSICWEMCTKEPPMFLDFCGSSKATDSGNNKSTKIRFDKDKFSIFKKTGDYIDYVVWPALYLTKGGSLMRKGVAQGIREDRKYEYERDRPE